jgi:hypothetical protein
MSDGFPWLSACHEAGQILGGVDGRLISGEFIAVEHPDREHYSPTAIRKLIDNNWLSALARRLCADRALAPYAFLCCEREAEQELLRCIDDLQSKYFDAIFESAPGVMRAFIPKGGRALVEAAAEAKNASDGRAPESGTQRDSSSDSSVRGS